jgi:tRNA (Thr-GGU) A37 N-methylase
MSIKMKPIGYVSTDAKEIPLSWTMSDVEGALVMDETYLEGLRDIQPGARIYVIFHFHKSPGFASEFMRVKPPMREKKLGVFSTHSPFRPNPTASPYLKMPAEGNVIELKIDMLDTTPFWIAWGLFLWQESPAHGISWYPISPHSRFIVYFAITLVK